MERRVTDSLRNGLIVLLLSILFWGCSLQPTARGIDGAAAARKITFDVDLVDGNGLIGPPGGKRALAYEFCIPDTPTHRTEVAAIDTSARFMPDSPGRIGCRNQECLCIGSTHQRGYRIVLERLAALSYIRRIDQSHFE
jgi:hypothetical protein